MFSWLKARFSRPQTTAVRDQMRFVGRARWIVHLFDEFGESCSREYGFDGDPLGYEDILVFEFEPGQGRDWWTYVTAGMSIAPALDGQPPTELIAYSAVERPGLVEVLYQLAFREPAVALAAGDIIELDDEPPQLGVPLSRYLGVVDSAERAHLLRFPDPSSRPEDIRYVMARPGEDDSPVRLLRIVGLRDGDGGRFLRERGRIEALKDWDLY